MWINIIPWQIVVSSLLSLQSGLPSHNLSEVMHWLFAHKNEGEGQLLSKIHIECISEKVKMLDYPYFYAICHNIYKADDVPLHSEFSSVLSPQSFFPSHLNVASTHLWFPQVKWLEGQYAGNCSIFYFIKTNS